MIYTILKNTHFCLPPILKFSTKNNFKWSIKFNNTCLYNIGEDQTDINKLIGVRMNLFSNHKDSFRFGWRYNNKTFLLEIFAYYYIDGKIDKINSPFLIAIPINKELNLELKFLQNNVEFIANGKSYTIKYSGRNKIKYFCSPYFGGNKKAQQNIQIEIKKAA